MQKTMKVSKEISKILMKWSWIRQNNFILLQNKLETMIIFQIRLKMIFQRETKTTLVIKVLKVNDLKA